MRQTIGIDIGSAALSFAVLDENAGVVNTFYRLHQGNITQTLRAILENIDISRVGGIAALMHHYPDISLFVQANPAFCCAGLVTEAMAPLIEKKTGIPVVTLNYDGTGKNINQKIRPYIKFYCAEKKKSFLA